MPSPSLDPVWTRRLTPTEQADLAGEALATNGAGAAPLAGLRFAVKDLIAVRGCVRGCGNPHWAARQQASTVSAVAVQRLLAAGARCLGTTWLDEFAFGLAGENAWGGTPPNPRAPGRIPGGSSSGSAAAVALGEADLALATDTAGSIRGPASWCGLWGLRPSHGAVSTAGVAALAPSLDTVGLFASSQEVLRQGMATLQERAAASDAAASDATASDAASETPPTVRAIGWIPELWDLADPAVAAPLQRQALELAEHLAHPLQPWPLAKLGIASPEPLQRLLEAVQWAEIEQSLAQLPSDLPVGPSLERNRALVAGRDRSQLAAAQIARHSLRERLQTLLGPGPSGGAALLLLPCTPTVAPPCGSLGIDRSTNSVIQRLLQLGALASLAGLPQLARPGSVDREHGLPVGLGVLTHAGGDRLLLELPAP